MEIARLRYATTTPRPVVRRKGSSVPQMRDRRWVADRLGMSESWVYENREELGGVKLKGAVRFPEKKILAYLRASGLR